MNFINNIISHFQKSKDVTTSNFPENENFENDDVILKDLSISQTSDSVSLLLNITDDIDYLNGSTKSCNDLQTTPEMVIDDQSEKSLMNLDEYFQNLDGVEETMYENDGCEVETCGGSQCVDNVIPTNAIIEETLFNLNEFKTFCDGIESTEENLDNEEFIAKNVQFVDDINARDDMIEETMIHLKEFDRICEEFNSTKDKSETACNISEKIGKEVEANSSTNLNGLNTVTVKTSNIGIANIQFIGDNNDQDLQNTSNEKDLIFTEFYDIAYEISGSEKAIAVENNSRSVSLMRDDDDGKTYATLTEVTPIACFGSNTADITKELNNINTGNINEDASVKALDVHDLVIDAVKSHNETQESQNTGVLNKHTISQIYPLAEDQNSIVYGVVLKQTEECNNLNNKFDNSEENKDMDDVISISSTEETDAKPKTTQRSKLNKISISSNEIEDSDHCSGYNSSDFEFISESEAKNCEITTKSIKSPKRNPKSKAVRDRNCKYVTFEEPANNNIDNNLPGPSNANNNIHSRPTFRNNFDHRHVLANREEDYRKTHRVPEGDEYLNLFQGIHAPAMMSEMYFMENKCIQARNFRNIQHNGLGFDMRLYVNQDDYDVEYRQEAADCAKKIMSMYPDDNNTRKRRRRF